MSTFNLAAVPVAATYTPGAEFNLGWPVRKLTIIVTGGSVVMQTLTKRNTSWPIAGIDEATIPAGFNPKVFPTAPIYGFRFRLSSGAAATITSLEAS